MNDRRLVVTGTRYGRADVGDELDAYVAAFGRPRVIILGADRTRKGVVSARGVDLQAYQWAAHLGIPGVRCCALWGAEGRPGPERNSRMIARARPGDHLLAFPAANSQGTWDCFGKGQRAGLYCVEVRAGWVEELRRLAA